MARTSVHEDKREGAILLRTERRLGTKEIHRRTGVPMSTLHYWLRPHPLTKNERSAIISASPRYVAPKKVLSARKPCDERPGLAPYNLCLLGESAVALRLAKRGLVVAKSMAEGDVVDFYVRQHRGEKVGFIQARVAASPPSRSGLPSISLRRYRNGKSNRFQRGDFHVLVGYCRENDTSYVFTFDELEHLANSVTVTDEAAEAWWKLDRFLEA